MIDYIESILKRLFDTNNKLFFTIKNQDKFEKFIILKYIPYY